MRGISAIFDPWQESELLLLTVLLDLVPLVDLVLTSEARGVPHRQGRERGVQGRAERKKLKAALGSSPAHQSFNPTMLVNYKP